MLFLSGNRDQVAVNPLRPVTDCPRQKAKKFGMSQAHLTA
jgi:hypothetical protein